MIAKFSGSYPVSYPVWLGSAVLAKGDCGRRIALPPSAEHSRSGEGFTWACQAVPFPNSEWVQNHLLGNINNRSSTYQRHWMLEDRYGNNISLLP